MVDIWHGREDIPCSGWDFAGVVLDETTPSSHSTVLDDGITDNMRGRGLYSMPRDGNAKRETITFSGQVDMVNMFESKGIQEGAALWLVIKKWDVGTHFNIVTSHKGRILDLPVDGVHHSFHFASVEEMAGWKAFKGLPKDELPKHPYRPVLGGLVATPDGSELADDFADYEDEWGYTQRGLKFRIGRIVFAPIHLKWQPPIMSPEKLKPYVDGYKCLLGDKMTILLDADRTGTFSVM
jgi:hypothetical protein